MLLNLSEKKFVQTVLMILSGVILAAGMAVSGCGDDDPQTADTGSDADTDSDTDTDTDSDGDGDTDTDSDSDTDTDTDTDSDTDGDTDSDTDSDSDGDSDTDSDTDGDTERDSDTLIELDTSTDWDSEEYEHPYRDPDLWIEHRVADLLSLLTPEEKLLLLDERQPEIARLGLGYLSTYTEGLHGLGQCDGGKIIGTQFPQAFGLGHTWDPELLREMGEIEGYEARVHMAAGNSLGMGLVIRAPMIDMGRDPRWGRTEESLGEDPFLVAELGKGIVRGLQGSDPKHLLAAATLKHFLGNNNETNRDFSSSDIDARDLREYYLVPFEKCIHEADAQSFMTAYNAINGIPASVTPLVNDIVYDEWQFDGMICTDAFALELTVEEHHYFSTLTEAAGAIVKAGVGVFLGGDEHQPAVAQAYQQGLISEADVDRVLAGMLRIRFRLGELDPPERVSYSSISGSETPWNDDAHRNAALKVAEKSMVLLKNENQTLPLDKSAITRVAVIGPRADDVVVDWYGGALPYKVSAMDAIERYLGATHMVTLHTDNNGGAAVDAARNADVAIVFVGNHPTCDAGWAVCSSAYEGKETIDRKYIELEPSQLTLIQDVYGANPNTVVVLVSSFPEAIPWVKDNIPAIVHIANSGQELGNAVAHVLFGDVNPAGRLSMTWYGATSDLPDLMDYGIRGKRTYMYYNGEPLFPFGHGLSYTSFAYDNLTADLGTRGAASVVNVSVDVSNTGSRDGDEVIQLYASFPESSVERPNLALKGFSRITLNTGESKTVHFTVPLDDLAYWNENENRFVIEPGPVTLSVGASSEDIRLSESVVLPDI